MFGWLPWNRQHRELKAEIKQLRRRIERREEAWRVSNTEEIKVFYDSVKDVMADVVANEIVGKPLHGRRGTAGRGRKTLIP